MLKKRSLIQYDVELLMINHYTSSKHFFQLALSKFGNTGIANFNPIDIKRTIAYALLLESKSEVPTTAQMESSTE